MSLKVSIILNSNDSNWRSCRYICSNLISSYDQLDKSHLFDIQYHYVDQKLDEEKEFSHLAEEIRKRSPNKIVFVDHDPQLIKLVSKLEIIFKSDATKPDLIFHIYGDFIEFSHKWKGIAHSLKSFSVKFICASWAQKKLLEKSFHYPHDIKVIPFPLGRGFYFDYQERQRERKKLGVKNDEFLFLYTGRLSLQKNDLDLVSHFLFLIKNMNIKAKLILAGYYDDFGRPYFGVHHEKGTHEKRYQDVLKQLSTSGDGEVVFLGDKTSAEIRKLLNASDCFISLSSHNDEDFGMSVAESGLCGLQTILTYWGGYIDLGNLIGENNSFIPLVYDKRHRPHSSLLIKAMSEKVQRKLDTNERYALSSKMSDYCSIESVVKKLADVLNEEAKRFGGVTKLFQRASYLVESYPSSPFWEFEKEDPLDTYKKLYRDYGDVTFLKT